MVLVVGKKALVLFDSLLLILCLLKQTTQINQFFEIAFNCPLQLNWRPCGIIASEKWNAAIF